MSNMINFENAKGTLVGKAEIKEILNGDAYRFIKKSAEDFETEMKESLQVFLRGMGTDYEVRTRRKEEMLLNLFEKVQDAKSEEERRLLMKTVSYIYPEYFIDVTSAIIEGNYEDDGSFVPDVMSFETYKASVDAAIYRLKTILEVETRYENVKYIALVNDFGQYATAALDHHMFRDPWK